MNQLNYLIRVLALGIVRLVIGRHRAKSANLGRSLIPHRFTSLSDSKVQAPFSLVIAVTVLLSVFFIYLPSCKSSNTERMTTITHIVQFQFKAEASPVQIQVYQASLKQ